MMKRIEHLEHYVLACLQDSSLAWTDLVEPSTFLFKLLGLIRRDALQVLKKIGKHAAIAVGEQLLSKLKGA